MDLNVDNYLYIAVLEEDEEQGGYTVIFPDLPGCITEGDDLSEAISNAKEVLQLHLFNLDEDGEEFNSATPIEVLKKQYNNDILIPIEIDLKAVRKALYFKSVPKNLTLPYWLKELAEQEEINFSETLQEALKQKLGIKDLDVDCIRNRIKKHKP